MAVTTNQNVQIMRLRGSRTYHLLPDTEIMKYKYTFSNVRGTSESSFLPIKRSTETLANNSCNSYNLRIIVNSLPLRSFSRLKVFTSLFFVQCIISSLSLSLSLSHTHTHTLSNLACGVDDRPIARDGKSPPQYVLVINTWYNN